MMSIILSGDGLLLSYAYLRSNSISTNTIKKWVTRGAVEKVVVKGKPFVKYSSIPSRTKEKLPKEIDLRAEANADSFDKDYTKLLETISEAYQTDFIKYRDEYKKDARLTVDQVTECSKLRAVWEKVLELNNSKRGSTEILYKAFNSIYPGRYKSYGAFCTIKTKAKKNINSVVIDERWFRTQPKAFDERVYFWASALFSDPLNNTAKSIWRKLTKTCNENSVKAPKYSWVKNFVKACEGNTELYSSKFGKKAAYDKKEPYSKIIYKYAGSRWEIDGWNLPFYMDGFERLVLFAVQDSHSKKILGYSVGKSEDTELILKGIENAVRNTGYIAAEIVSDNHSFNKTFEAGNFKLALDTIGVIWTISHLPRHKSIIEGSFKIIGEQYCKNYPGYVGQGIKTRERTGRPSQEYLDQFQKAGYFRTEDEIKVLIATIIHDFNNDIRYNSKSPNQLHESSEKPHTITLDLFDRLRLFRKATVSTVTRGQINLKRGGHLYEYQLTAEQYAEFNDKKVLVRFESYDTVCLYDERDRALFTVNQKPPIHGARAEQTERDIELLNKSKGRLNGIRAKARKENETLRNKMSPDAFEALNPATTPKDILKEAERRSLIGEIEENLNVKVNLLEVGKNPPSLIPKSLQPTERIIKSPFSVRGKHKIDKVELDKDMED